MVLVLTEDDVTELLDLEALIPHLADAFVAQHEGRVERPDRPHYPIGTGRDPDSKAASGTGLAMPAYIHGAPYAVTKLATVFEGNEARGLPTVTAQILVHDADDGQPVALLAGTTITSARTGCIGGLAARELAADPVSLAVFGAGTQARWQTRAIAAGTTLESVVIYSPSDSRLTCARELDGELEASVRAVDSPEAALADASVVVTATTSTEPVFDGAALESGALVIAVGAYTDEMRELDDRTIERARWVYADVPEEARETGDLRHHEELEIEPFGGLFAASSAPDADSAGTQSGERPPTNEAGDVTVCASVGTAVLDAATAAFVLEHAPERGVGRRHHL